MRALLGAAVEVPSEELGRWVELAGGSGASASSPTGVAGDARHAWVRGQLREARKLAMRWSEAASGQWDRLGLEALELWLLWAEGQPVSLERAETLERQARQAGMAGWVLDAAMVGAHVCCEAGDIDAALERARRAARMARTESMPHWEFLAALTLARMRRHAGRPFLARIIVDQVGQWLPPVYQPWADWERTLASGDEPAVDAAERWAEHRSHGQDLRALRELAGVDRPAESEFTRGRTDVAPRGLHAHAGVQGCGVWVPSEGEARRVARSALESTSPSHDLRGLNLRRPTALLAALSLSPGQTLPLTTLFERVYGFSYVPARHDGTLRVLIHRTRNAIEEAGRIERAGDSLALHWNGATAFCDPRTAIQEDAQFLTLLSAQPEVTARIAAERLGLPLRTSQDALRRLTKEGVCGARKEGRAVVYTLEDTTYRDPTGVLRGAPV